MTEILVFSNLLDNMNSNLNIINPKDWILVHEFIKNEKSLLYNVLPINENFSDEEKTFLNSKNWVLKLIDDPHELDIITQLKLYNNDLFLKIIDNSLYYNYDNKYYWYIMEKYDDNIYNNFLFAQINLIQLGNYMIKFFKYLHVDKKYIHGDIKPNNIVCSYSNKDYPFKIIDFESTRTQSNKMLCNESHNDNYYFYYIGCDYNKPFYSYRMDLEAFGCILYSIAISEYKYYLSNWQKEAIRSYDNKIPNQFYNLVSMKKLYNKENKLKNNEYENIINKYFNIIEKQDWFADTNIKVYEELEKLFALK